MILGIAVPIYFVQGTERGVLQGRMKFGVLALSYQAEMWSRLVISIVLVSAGYAVLGVVGAVALSFVAAWLVARRARIGLPASTPLSAPQRKTAILFAGPVAVALVGQILINNSDVLIVKHFFNPVAAGQYAALALIGRVVFFATWSVMTVLVPVAARAQQKQSGHWHLLWLSLGMVALVSAGIIGASIFYGTEIVTLLFGSAYLAIVPSLWIYASATGLFAMVNVIITYRLSVGNVRVSVFGILGGVTQVILLWLFHESLHQVVMIQVYLMGGLFMCLLGWELWMHHREVVAQRKESNLSLRLKSIPNV